MKLKTYEVYKGTYNGVVSDTITIPSDIVYLTGGKHDIGSGLHTKHDCLHYIGIVKGEDYYELSESINGTMVDVIKFNDDYCFITLNNLAFKFDAPKIINPDILSEEDYKDKLYKWNLQIDFPRYFVALYSKEMCLVKMVKIQQIRSEFDIQVNVVYSRNSFDIEQECKSIEQEIYRLDNFCFPGSFNNLMGVVVEGEVAQLYWDKLIWEVLKPFNFYHLNYKELNDIDSKLSDTNEVYKIVNDFLHNNKMFDGQDLEDLLYMRKCNLSKIK